MVLDNLPDESLMRAVASRRMGRPDATPVRVKWNCLLVGRVLGHRKMSALLSELRRNSSLRRLVGIHPAKGWKGVPDKDEMSRFWKKLVKHFRGEVDEVLSMSVEKLREHLADLGEQLGTDTTALRAWARGRKQPCLEIGRRWNFDSQGCRR